RCGSPRGSLGRWRDPRRADHGERTAAAEEHDDHDDIEHDDIEHDDIEHDDVEHDDVDHDHHDAADHDHHDIDHDHQHHAGGGCLSAERHSVGHRDAGTGRRRVDGLAGGGVQGESRLSGGGQP